MEENIAIDGAFAAWEKRWPQLKPYLQNKEYLYHAAQWVAIEDIEDVLEMWDKPERYYHNIDHLAHMLSCAPDLFKTHMDKVAYMLAALYHDAVYNPRASDNEEKSAALFMDHFGPAKNDEQKLLSATVIELIELTKDHTKLYDNRDGYMLKEAFICADLATLTSSDLGVLIETETKIMKEYQFVPYEMYQAGRVAILGGLRDFILRLNNDSAIDGLISHVENRKIRVGVYAGSFFPMHMGHYSILKRAERVFDKVIVAMGVNSQKGGQESRRTYLTERLAEDILPFHQVEFFEGSLTDYVKQKSSEYVDVTLVRGLGRSTDFEMEKMQMRYMEDMDPSINVAFFISDRRFEYLSSSGARVILPLDEELYQEYTCDTWPDAEGKIKGD